MTEAQLQQLRARTPNVPKGSTADASVTASSKPRGRGRPKKVVTVKSEVGRAIATKSDAPLTPVAVLDDEGARKAAVALRVAGFTRKEIADEMGVSVSYVDKLIRAAKDTGLAKSVLHSRAIPLALDNLINGLEQADKDYTLKTLEGTGVLGKHVTHEGGPKQAFQFNIVVESPSGGTRDVVAGSIVGVPRQLEGERE